MWDVTYSTYIFIASYQFLLTHPVWDVTRCVLIVYWGNLISTHTSRVGCDLPLLWLKACRVTFLLTHPVWDVTQCRQYVPEWIEFLLTHPVWDVTGIRFFFEGSAEFLLTHPVWDVTAIYSILHSQHPHISRDGLIIHLELY